jgi:hypothetical protein
MLIHRFFVNLAWIVALVSVIGLVILLTTVSPDSIKNILLFYLAVFGVCMSVFTLIGFYLRRLFGSRELVERYLSLSSRQALWFSLIVMISLLLSSYQLFSWINAIFLLLVFVFLESYLIAKKPNQ